MMATIACIPSKANWPSKAPAPDKGLMAAMRTGGFACAQALKGLALSAPSKTKDDKKPLKKRMIRIHSQYKNQAQLPLFNCDLWVCRHLIG
jgi:hypothetical protein